MEERQTVTALLTESGWGWATKESGQSGWVPLECLRSEQILSIPGRRLSDRGLDMVD